MSSLSRKLAKKSQAAQLTSLLNSLTPNLQEVNNHLQRVSGIAPSLQQMDANWSEVIKQIQDRVDELYARQEQNRAVLLTLIHQMGSADGPLSLEQLLSEAQRLDEQYEMVAKQEMDK